MATGKIIKRTVDDPISAGAPAFLWDVSLKGNGIKILPSGRATYILQYRMGGAEAKSRRFTIGTRTGSFSLGQASNFDKRFYRK